MPISSATEGSLIFVADLSPGGESALDYAIAIAVEQHWRLEILHCFYVSVAPGANQYLYDQEKASKKYEAEGKMRAMLEHIKTHNYPHSERPLEIHSQILEGNYEDNLLKIAEATHTKLILMRTQSKHKLADSFLSGSSDIYKRIKCPILTVPPEAHFKGFHHIVYTTDFDNADHKIIQELINFSRKVDAKLDCLHITTSGKNLIAENQKMTLLQEKFSNFTDEKLRFKVILEKKMVNGLENYLDKNEPNLLVMLNHEQGFIDRLLSRNPVKYIALNARIPTLVYRKNS
ncbi:MAG: universal stress protein [Bernardetiaceae bacterium]|nr:universal stress protein [Bernardetiaceae bacterium]